MPERKVEHGNCELWWAPISEGKIWAPKRWRGLGSTEQESEQDSENIYKDDSVYYTLEGKSTYKLTIKVAQIPSGIAMETFGYSKTTVGAYVKTSQARPCALMIKTRILDGNTGKEIEKLKYFYHATPNDPKIETSTDEEKPKENELEIEFTCTESPYVTDADGVPTAVSFIEKTDANASFFNNYKTEVLKPTPAVATVDLGGDK